MTKLIFTLVLFFAYNTPIRAESCFPLYEKKAQEIQDDKAYTRNIGGQIYVDNGQLNYWPGVEVPGHVDNWARDFVHAIKYGPGYYSGEGEDPKLTWLEAFRKTISDQCKLPKGNHNQLRSMLKELMEDGSFCPDKKILESTFLAPKKKFKEVLKDAVKDQRFVDICQGKNVANDSSRSIKEVPEKKEKSSESKEALKQ